MTAFQHWVVTGGIACGKSTVMEELGRLLPTSSQLFSCDTAVHVLLGEDSVVAEIRQVFGDSVLDSEGCVDRALLGDRVFESPKDRKTLESILHPLVFRQWEAEVKRAREQEGVHLLVAEVPLYYETEAPVRVDQVVAVLSNPEMQTRRLMQHRGLTLEKSQSILSSQMPGFEKAALADRVIWNDGSREALQRQVQLLTASADPNHD